MNKEITLSRCFACVKCGEPIHDSVEPMIELYSIDKNGNECNVRGPYHEHCAEEEKENK